MFIIIIKIKLFVTKFLDLLIDVKYSSSKERQLGRIAWERHAMVYSGGEKSYSVSNFDFRVTAKME